MKVVIAGGGTGGHLFPAVAVGDELVRERADTGVLYVGTSAGFEAKWLPNSGRRYELLEVHGLRGHSVVERLRATVEFGYALALSQALLKREKPDLVVAAGGYASAPVTVAAIVSRIPIVMMEQNTLPGLSNRLLWRFANKICVAFSDTKAYLKTSRVEVTGLPVRYRVNPSELPVSEQILVLGGSTGAHRLNIGVISAFKICANSVINLPVIHQTGEGDVTAIREAYRELPRKAEVAAFIDDVPAALARATLVIARSGGGTVCDIALAGRAAIFVPYPFHRDMQQLHNAQVIERVGGAVVIRDDQQLAEGLAREIATLIGDRKRREEMGTRARGAMPPDASRRIAKICFEVAGVADAGVTVTAAGDLGA